MTTVTIFGQQPEVKQKKAIEFCKLWMPDGTISGIGANPKCWPKIALIQRGNPYDLMVAYNVHPDDGCRYLGHFNDGFVEGQEEERKWSKVEIAQAINDAGYVKIILDILNSLP